MLKAHDKQPHHGIMTLRFWETLLHGADGLRCFGNSLLYCADPSAAVKVTARKNNDAPTLFSNGYDDALVCVCVRVCVCVGVSCV